VLNGIVRFSLRFRGVVVALGLAVVAYGIFGLARAKYDVFPEFASPEVVVQTEATGLSPEQVEVLVAQPIENALAGTPGLEGVRSYSIQGVSVVTLLFGSRQDIYLDRQLVAERLGGLAGQLPHGVAAPVMVPLTSSTGDLMVVGLTSDRLDLMQLRTVADWTVTPRLLAVPGIAKAGTYGGDVRQLQVQLDPAALILTTSASRRWWRPPPGPPGCAARGGWTPPTSASSWPPRGSPLRRRSSAGWSSGTAPRAT